MIIGIHGRMRTGKSELARLIKAHYEGDFSHVRIASFANRLRQECAEMMFPLHGKEGARRIWDVHEDSHKESMRPMLQAVGQAKRMLINTDYWVHALAEDNPDYGNHSTLLIIDDVRHENEARWILENGGVFIRLDASRETLIERGATEERLAHFSETAMNRITDTEREYAHRCLRINTSGLSVQGTFKGLRRFITELIMGVEE